MSTWGWIGFDLDGTLARHERLYQHDRVGEPLPRMVERAKAYLDQGYEVRILTARAAEPNPITRAESVAAIDRWCLAQFGKTLPVTCQKDYGMIRLYDDRAVQARFNTGDIVRDQTEPAVALYAFMGWLTTRSAVSGPFSRHYEASQAAELVKEFCDSQGWTVSSSDWHTKLRDFPPEAAAVLAEGDARPSALDSISTALGQAARSIQSARRLAGDET